MKKAFWLAATMLAGLALPSLAMADETVTDWKGTKIHLKEGEVTGQGGVKIHYYTVGEGPLLFISHGNGSYWFDWRNQFDALSKHYKVVIYDLRGFNKSGHPTGTEKNTNAIFGEDLLAVQNHFTDGPAIHIGHDQGGMVLWGYAMNHPEKVRLLIEENSIHPRAFVRELAYGQEQPKASWYIQQLIEDTAKGLEWERGVMNPDSPRRIAADGPEIHKMRVEAFKRTTDAGLQGTTDWYRVDFPGKPYTPDAKAFGSHGEDFPLVKAPTLVIHSLNDGALMPGGVNRLGTFIDNEFTLVTLPGAGHNAHQDIPEKVNGIITNWLNMHDVAPNKLTQK